MNEVFNSNNPAMRFLSNIFNMFWANLLFIFTCLPIITIGPSLCGLYKVCLKICSGEDPIVHQEYFREFKNSFKKGTILWVGVLLATAFFSIELYGIYFRPDLVPANLSFLQYPVWFMLFLVLDVFLYGFAIIATFETTLKNAIKNSILLSIRNVPITLILIAIWLFVPVMINTFPTFMYGFLGFEVFFNLAFRILCCSLFLHKAFGLKKFKYNRKGEATEISYDDMIISDEETESSSEGSASESKEESTDEGSSEETKEVSESSEEEKENAGENAGEEE
ncbi:MAG: YesL family protein [Clostridiales bacterium]|nr:YesL family protein [Clostridiales bacterium]